MKFKKLSDDSMYKLIFSNKKYTDWFLERFLNKKIQDYKIINKINNEEINEEKALELLKQELNTKNAHVKKKTMQQGLEQGIEQGLEQGLERGIEQNKIQTALSLLKNDVPFNIIEDATGFSYEFIKSLKS